MAASLTFAETATAFAHRFLSDRSLELIVTPALADLEFDAERGASPVSGRLAVVRALAGGLLEDLSRSSTLGTMAAMVLIAAGYYCCLLFLVSPIDLRKSMTLESLVVVAVVVLVLSVVPALVCAWPSRPDRSTAAEVE